MCFLSTWKVRYGLQSDQHKQIVAILKTLIVELNWVPLRCTRGQSSVCWIRLESFVFNSWCHFFTWKNKSLYGFGDAAIHFCFRKKVSNTLISGHQNILEWLKFMTAFIQVIWQLLLTEFDTSVTMEGKYAEDLTAKEGWINKVGLSINSLEISSD